jgi:integrase
LNHDMPRPHLPYLQRETGRGKTFWYVRTSRETPRIRIHGEYGSDRFNAEYQAAISGSPVVRKSLTTAHKGSLKWLADKWRESSDWHMKADATKRQRENILHRIMQDNGDLPFTKIKDSDIVDGRERRMKTPFAANNYLKTVKALFAWAKSMKLVSVDPAKDVELLSRKTEGHEPWTANDVDLYRACWPLGTRQRVAFELLYTTGLRRGDAVIVGRQHIGKDGRIRIKTEKTGHAIAIRIVPALASVLGVGPIGDLAFITGEKGGPLTKESFGTQFRHWCDKAGVSKSAHGLRKLAAIETAEGGASEMELNASFGWSTKEQSSTYTRNAQAEKLADQAAEKRAGNKSIPEQNMTLPNAQKEAKKTAC